ncbi:MAG: PEP-CTERM sorting domain-containing protein [Acidobacteriales bacterium]|nr:PEP-CTERM sorting domain-containing protein [Terriglobales bacterium]
MNPRNLLRTGVAVIAVAVGLPGTALADSFTVAGTSSPAAYSVVRFDGTPETAHPPSNYIWGFQPGFTPTSVPFVSPFSGQPSDDPTYGDMTGTTQNGPNTNQASATNWTFLYQTTFSLAGLNPATAQLNMTVTADNSFEIFLNGADTGIGGNNWQQLYTAVLSSGFIAGTNTLDFYVNNYPGVGANPAALSVVVNSATAAPIVPEPTSFLMIGTGLIGTASVMRRFKR